MSIMPNVADNIIRVFIGFDAGEEVAYHVLSRSIHRHASVPVSITPIMRSQLHSAYTRKRQKTESTEFSLSRFLVPHLCNFQGWAIFMDCDMLMRDDIANIWALRHPDYALQVVKHDYRPKEKTKFLGRIQTQYNKKNWSSVMLFNNAKCHALTTDYVNNASGLDLHQFIWLNNDALIGDIPKKWNYLVGYYPPINIQELSLIHYTLGGPYFDDYKHCDYADAWMDEYHRMIAFPL